MTNLILKEPDSPIKASDYKVPVEELELMIAPSNNIDFWMDSFVNTRLNTEYTNIFIPLSFGTVLTDYLGLRLAWHLRTTTKHNNQLANIFIYGVSSFSELAIKNGLSSILITEGTKLIDYNIQDISQALLNSDRILSEESLSQILHKLKLDIPENYYDSHSIANIWGMFRLLELAGLKIQMIESLQKQKERLSGLYFKWLMAKDQYTIFRDEETKNVDQKFKNYINLNALEPSKPMKILFIDDEADSGWAEILQNVLNIKPFQLTSAVTSEQAIILLQDNEYDIIFLDLRMGESDHQHNNISNYGGYKLLTSTIRCDFENKNFPTSIFLFTASQKAWNIVASLENGADDFYIKEHPDQANDISFSQKNYKKLKEGFFPLLELGKRRRMVWNKLCKVQELAKKNILNPNIQLRINEKLKIGYGVLFNKTKEFEKNKLIFNNEILAFIVFWSILEEISHDFYNRTDKKEIEWKLRKDNFILQKVVGEEVESCFPSLMEHDLIFTKSPLKENAYMVSLSQQITGILRGQLHWAPIKITEFKKLNAYRNDIDFIHSDTHTILTNSLKVNQDSKEGFKKCNDILDFIITILN